MSKNEKDIIDLMFNNDPFSKWLGIERIKDGKGISVLKMKVREDMLNGLGVAHGGITYSLADSALAFAANSYGKKAMSVDSSISHLTKVFDGDILKTKVLELNRSNRIATYKVFIENQNEEMVAAFKGTVYISQKDW